MKRLLPFLFIIPGIVNAANGYKNKASVDSAPAKGFYKIVLSPEVVSYIASDYPDIRLINGKQQEVPYLFIQEKSSSSRSFFKELEIVDNSPLYTPKLSRIVIENTDKRRFTELLFIIRNTAIEPEVILKGSDDNKNWFFISRGYLTGIGSVDSDTSEIRAVQFPKNNYKYFEITIPHKKGEAIQFIKAGYSNSEYTNGLFTQIPTPKIIQKDSAKMSYLTIVFSHSYEINKLEFDIAGPEYYLRSGHIGQYVKLRKQAGYFDPIYSLTFSSNKKNTWEFENLKTDTLFVEIENEDNPPLQIKVIKAFQLNRYLVAQLNSGEKYELYFNNPDATSPNYDLKYFADLIPSDLKTLGISSLQTIGGIDKAQPSSQFFNKQVVWIILIVVVIALGAISIKLLNEMKNTKKTA